MCFTDAITLKIKSKNDILGYAFAINGEINSVDVYGGSILFDKMRNRIELFTSKCMTRFRLCVKFL